MTATRYRESRTLGRKITRLPGQDKRAYRANVLRLREHFRQFSVDVSELCQWLMSLRPVVQDDERFPQRAALGPFWTFFLEPAVDGVSEERELHRLRRALLDFILGLCVEEGLGPLAANERLLTAARTVRELPATPTASKLFDRLKAKDPGHRLVLAQAAADWIVARYQRGMDNWVRGHEEWLKEKNAWEAKEENRALNTEVRQRFNEIFKKLGIKQKRPKVCDYERLLHNADDCLYAGHKRFGERHGPLCVKFFGFRDKLDKARGGKAIRFVETAKLYLALRDDVDRLKLRPDEKRAKALERLPASILSAENEQHRRRPKEGAKGGKPKSPMNEHQARAMVETFQAQWSEYLRALGIDEETVLRSRGRHGSVLPHCTGRGECKFNEHTEDCRKYRVEMANLPAKLRKRETLYREWREKYLAGPRRPTFKYPSARKLPMPKIFGTGYWEADFTRNILRLRLDDMPAGQWLEFGFSPWPRDYSPRPDKAEITSVHVTFVGTRPRVGFHFKVKHKPSRIAVSQDEIDRLRSREFPRESQDNAFLRAARESLLRAAPEGGKDLKVLAIDLGITGAGYAVMGGRNFIEGGVLNVVKLDKIRPERPRVDPQKKQERDKVWPDDAGLSEFHIARHLQSAARKVRELANHRVLHMQQPSLARAPEDPKGVLGDHDLRGRFVHLRRMIKDWVRLNAAQVIAKAKEVGADIIAFESGRGFLAPARYLEGTEELKKKKRLAFQSFGAIRRKVTEKAVEAGMRTVTLPYKESSKVCFKCGQIQQDKKRLRDNKGKKKFVCEHKACGAECHSDENAARVLGRVFWGEITLPDEQPRRATGT